MTPPRGAGRRPLGFTLLAALLTWYALGGTTLAALVVRNQDPRLRWPLLAVAGVVFAAAAGTAALAVWRMERWAPRALVACAVGGAMLSLLLPMAMPSSEVGPDTWRSAVLGAVLFGAFFLLAAMYVRRRRPPPP